jgi:hypothetical protein
MYPYTPVAIPDGIVGRESGLPSPVAQRILEDLNLSSPGDDLLPPANDPSNQWKERGTPTTH